MNDIAKPGKRLTGFLLDFVILFLAVLALIPLTGGIDVDAVAAGEPLPRNLVAAAFALGTAYQIVFVAMRGQTPGKIFVRTMVVNETTSNIPSWWQSIVRWFVPAVAASLPGGLSLLWLAVYLWLLMDERSQGLHDKAARTVVVDLDAPRTTSSAESG